MKLTGRFSMDFGCDTLTVKWVGSAIFWPGDEFGPGEWDYEITEMNVTLAGEFEKVPRSLTALDVDSDIWEFLEQRAHDEMARI